MPKVNQNQRAMKVNLLGARRSLVMAVASMAAGASARHSQALWVDAGMATATAQTAAPTPVPQEEIVSAAYWDDVESKIRGKPTHDGGSSLSASLRPVQSL